LTPALCDALARDRGRYVVATGTLFGFVPGSLRRAVESARRRLGTEVIDVF
jgi:aryl-alcohol dehydrogenase-like predicted oxidoreductase